MWGTGHALTARFSWDLSWKQPAHHWGQVSLVSLAWACLWLMGLINSLNFKPPFWLFIAWRCLLWTLKFPLSLMIFQQLAPTLLFWLCHIWPLCHCHLSWPYPATLGWKPLPRWSPLPSTSHPSARHLQQNKLWYLDAELSPRRLGPLLKIYQHPGFCATPAYQSETAVSWVLQPFCTGAP